MNGITGGLLPVIIVFSVFLLFLLSDGRKGKLGKLARLKMPESPEDEKQMTEEDRALALLRLDYGITEEQARAVAAIRELTGENGAEAAEKLAALAKEMLKKDDPLSLVNAGRLVDSFAAIPEEKREEILKVINQEYRELIIG